MNALATREHGGPYLTVAEVAANLACSEPTVRRRIRDGELPAVQLATTDRSSAGLWLSEAVATFGLVVLIFGLVRAGRAALAPFAVGAYITAAYWWSSSTSFANPMIDLARTLSDTFAGIAPASVPMFLLMQLAGAAAGVAVVAVLYPTVTAVADAVVVPKESP